MPVRKRGRPKNCSRALEREDDLRPGDWRKSPIRHVDYGMGFVVDYRIKPDTKRTVVWRVRFPDSPGGEQDFEMEAEDLTNALELYQAWMKKNTLLTF